MILRSEFGGAVFQGFAQFVYQQIPGTNFTASLGWEPGGKVSIDALLWWTTTCYSKGNPITEMNTLEFLQFCDIFLLVSWQKVLEYRDERGTSVVAELHWGEAHSVHR